MSDLPRGAGFIDSSGIDVLVTTSNAFGVR